MRVRQERVGIRRQKSEGGERRRKTQKERYVETERGIKKELGKGRRWEEEKEIGKGRR